MKDLDEKTFKREVVMKMQWGVCGLAGALIAAIAASPARADQGYLVRGTVYAKFVVCFTEPCPGPQDPAANVIVTVRNVNGKVVKRVKTNNFGIFQMKLPSGQYKLRTNTTRTDLALEVRGRQVKRIKLIAGL